MAAATCWILADDPDFLRLIVERVIQGVLDAEMTAHLHAGPYERSANRTGYRNGHTPRQLNTRDGTLTLQIPQDRDGTWSVALAGNGSKRKILVTNGMRRCYRRRQVREAAPVEVIGKRIDTGDLQITSVRIAPATCQADAEKDLRVLQRGCHRCRNLVWRRVLLCAAEIEQISEGEVGHREAVRFARCIGERDPVIPPIN